jgi:hypothetical protein
MARALVDEYGNDEEDEEPPFRVTELVDLPPVLP